MDPSFESATASVSLLHCAFTNLRSPLLSLPSTRAVMAPSASAVLLNLSNAFSWTTCECEGWTLKNKNQH